jgi:hypothetical protein
MTKIQPRLRAGLFDEVFAQASKQRASLLLPQIAPNFPKQVFNDSATSRGYLPRNGNN